MSATDSDFPQKVAAIVRNGWPTYFGLGGRHGSESLADMHRIMQLIGIAAAEILLLILYNIFIKKTHVSLTQSIYRIYLGVGVASFGILYFFYKNNYSFASNDTLYMLIMAKDILVTGLLKWHFASPAGMGIFVPILQTIGLLFNLKYTWFIQPFISILFFSFFFYFCYRVIKSRGLSIWMAASLPILLIAAMLSSNLIFAYTTYIHSNFDSAFFLFLSVMTLLFYIDEKNENWLFFTAFFFVLFGLTRVENILFACITIIIFLGDGKLPYKKILTTFVPFLIILFFWYLIIFHMKTNSYTDQMDPKMIILVLIGIIGVLLLLFISGIVPIRKFIDKYFFRYLPYILLIILAGVFMMNFNTTLANLLTTLENLYVAGNWWLLWGFVTILAIIIIIYSPKGTHENTFIYLIITFFELIFVLGALRDPYHLGWSDSANRMVVHILPVILVYLLDKLSLWYAQSRMTESTATLSSAEPSERIK